MLSDSLFLSWLVHRRKVPDAFHEHQARFQHDDSVESPGWCVFTDPMAQIHSLFPIRPIREGHARRPLDQSVEVYGVDESAKLPEKPQGCLLINVVSFTVRSDLYRADQASRTDRSDHLNPLPSRFLPEFKHPNRYLGPLSHRCHGAFCGLA